MGQGEGSLERLQRWSPIYLYLELQDIILDKALGYLQCHLALPPRLHKDRARLAWIQKPAAHRQKQNI